MFAVTVRKNGKPSVVYNLIVRPIVIYDADNIAVKTMRQHFELAYINYFARNRFGGSMTTELFFVGSDLIVKFPKGYRAIVAFADKKTAYDLTRKLIRRNPGRYCDHRDFPL